VDYPIRADSALTGALALGAVLVYAGEHYVVDLAAGFALALLVKRAPLPLP
jgi:membrane-associated phospholipid phosphatase